MGAFGGGEGADEAPRSKNRRGESVFATEKLSSKDLVPRVLKKTLLDGETQIQVRRVPMATGPH
jgi:hypothetical protein